mmetsp:Transcript_80632/g.209588  ORF Transcript_80632/g.209588 Transcript_80632/m.209588 type:complete len:271 (+) Transcript_80632:280-1092(+)
MTRTNRQPRSITMIEAALHNGVSNLFTRIPVTSEAVITRRSKTYANCVKKMRSIASKRANSSNSKITRIKLLTKPNTLCTVCAVSLPKQPTSAAFCWSPAWQMLPLEPRRRRRLWPSGQQLTALRWITVHGGNSALRNNSLTTMSTSRRSNSKKNNSTLEVCIYSTTRTLQCVSPYLSFSFSSPVLLSHLNQLLPVLPAVVSISAPKAFISLHRATNSASPSANVFWSMPSVVPVVVPVFSSPESACPDCAVEACAISAPGRCGCRRRSG